MYADKTLQERQDFGQFFTPPELSIRMLEKLDSLEGTILDPTCGAGNLLAAAIAAGADPKKCYGIELDEDILLIAQSRLKDVPAENLHRGNALYEECYEFYKEYDYDNAVAAAEKRIATEATKIEIPKTGFSSFFRK